jgi:hypothetical protein
VDAVATVLTSAITDFLRRAAGGDDPESLKYLFIYLNRYTITVRKYYIDEIIPKEIYIGGL